MPKTRRQPPVAAEALVTVYPTKASALNVSHPTGGPLKIGGSQWPKDGFTHRMMVQRITTEHRHLAYKPEAEKPDDKPAKADDKAPKAADAPADGPIKPASNTPVQHPVAGIRG